MVCRQPAELADPLPKRRRWVACRQRALIHIIGRYFEGSHSFANGDGIPQFPRTVFTSGPSRSCGACDTLR
jgi:hypothetical protein